MPALIQGVLTQIIPGVFLIPGVTNVGVLTDTKNSITNIYLVDTGRTEEQGNIVLKAITDYFTKINQQFCIKAIFHTHSHIDHYGADLPILKSFPECLVFASKDEKAIIDNPYLQTSIIWGGYPISELTDRFYKPVSIPCVNILDSSTEFTFTSETSGNPSTNKITFIDLPGHSFADIGVLATASTGEKVLFAGDAISTKEYIDSNWFLFVLKPEEFLSSLDKITEIPHLDYCISSHINFIIKNIPLAAEECRIHICRMKNEILGILKENPEGLSTEELMKKIAHKNNVSMGLSQYNLLHTTILSYLSCLHNSGSIKMKVSENQLIWES